MPKLSAEKAKQVNEAETGGGGSFEPLPEGKYRVKLIDVESGMTRGANGKAPAPKWVWKFEVLHPSEHEGRWLWEHTAIQDSTLWKLNQIFAAFGVPADTDTDELMGRSIDIMVAQRVIGAGKNQGKMGNDISEFIPASGSSEAAPAQPKQDGSEIPF